tara:strand:- start:415 stop:1449 length:1035 start_codon:yes stop_codon:yes gene_type:complete
MKNKLQGCLIGAAIGDSLGLPYEGLSSSVGKKLFGTPDKHKLLFGLGMVSDDTEHLVIVLNSFRQAKGDVENFSKILASKLKLWTLVLPIGVGKASLVSGIKLLFGYSYKNSGIFSAGNAPAMRVSVLGLLCEDNNKLKDFVKRTTNISHTDPKAYRGALAIAVGAKLASENNKVDPNSFLEQFKSINNSKSQEFDAILEKTIKSVSANQSTQKFAESLGLIKGVSGYTYHTVPVALHGWLSNQNNFRDGLMSIIQCGGDTDTVGSIVGSLIGIQVGIKNIPLIWRRGLFDYPLNEKNLSQISMDTFRRSLLKELIVIPIRQILLLILIIFHYIYRALGSLILK